jgi:hypothetical protein
MQVPFVTLLRRPGVSYTWPHPYWDCEVEGRKCFEQVQKAFADVEFVFETA